MFQRRLKILLGVIIALTSVLVMRAGYLQVVQGSEYQRRAAETARRTSPVETTRGTILDFRGREVAVDAPCIDACVDYRAIKPDAKEAQEWIRAQARARLVARGVLKGDRDDRARLVDAEVEKVRADIKALWGRLAEVSGRPYEEIDEVRQGIVRRVEMRRRYVWYKKYEEARERHEKGKAEPSPAWYRWLIDDSQAAPQLDSFQVTVSEQTEAHVVLRAIDNDAVVKLDKLREQMPGLELKKNTHRYYPFGDLACHVLGNLAPVMRQDLEKNPHVLSVQDDEGRKYFYNDMIGRSGVERLCEPDLRGTRGSVVRQLGRDGVVATTPPLPGRNVRVTLDMDLQMRVQEAFLKYEERDDPLRPGQDLRVQRMPVHEMHGAAVVIDVPSGEVRAMVSYPTYDLNQLDLIYPKLAKDRINQPLLNRATQAALEPGSTAKPMVGLAAVTAGLFRPDETIECTGYLVINGQPRREGRCWVATKFAHMVPSVAHHPIPSSAPHPTGFLTFADGLERSCNVFFETLADRLRLDGLGQGYRRFGLGRLTEVGIPEVPGRVPGDTIVANPRSAAWFSGIGQSQVLATPLQMANVAATIARRGVWVRPHLLVSESAEITRHDLGLSPAALEQCVDGMTRVVNGPAGTGKALERKDIVVAGKTGTAQAAPFNLIIPGPDGKPMRDEKGRIARQYFKPSTPEEPNEQMPWYRGSGNSGSELGHAWFIGFAPARNPQIAFAVMVEYGGSGGRDAAPIANAILEACVKHGYLSSGAVQ